MIDILISTYNSKTFIKEQIKSLLSQIHINWYLIIRDDGSKNNTFEIVEKYTSNYPEKIVLTKDNSQNLGACQSFSKLLQYSTADYIMFCDQDDVWLPEKIELTLNKITELETKYKDKPILVHTDLKVVDKDLNILADSFWKYQNLNPRLKGLHHLLVQNNVTGCTVMINKKLKELASPIPPEAIMHDWWLALVASAFGIIDYIETPTVLYRQHGKNDIGAKRYSLPFIFSRLKKFDESLYSVKKTVTQAKAFYARYKDLLTKEQAEIVYNYATLFEKPKIERLRSLFKYKFKKHGFARNIGFILAVLLGGEDNFIHNNREL